MTEPVANDNPPSPRGANYRVLLAVVIILGVLIVVAFGVLVAGFILGWSNHDRPAAAPVAAPATTAAPAQPWLAQLDVPAGMRIADVHADGGRVVVHLVSPAGGEEIVLVDAATGRVIGRIALKPPA